MHTKQNAPHNHSKHLFGSNNTFFTSISSIQSRDLNLQPLADESPPFAARPGLEELWTEKYLSKPKIHILVVYVAIIWQTHFMIIVLKGKTRNKKARNRNYKKWKCKSVIF